jgi:hypothetical protein
VTGRAFDLIVTFDRAPGSPGRAIAESSFHHFADCDWDLSLGAPSFVTEAPGEGMRKESRALEDIGTYVLVQDDDGEYHGERKPVGEDDHRDRQDARGEDTLHVDDLHESEGGYDLHVLDAASVELLAQNSTFDESDRRPRSSAA